MKGSPAQVNFGNVDASGSSKARKVSISNKGASDAVIGTVSASSAYLIVPGSDLCSNQTVLSKKSCTMMLQFSPTAPGPSSDTLSVNYNGIPATVSLSGNARAVTLKAPSKVTFAPVVAGSAGPQKSFAI